MPRPPHAAAAGSRRPASPSSSASPPRARRGHRAESPHEPLRPDAPFRRLNQDCVDIIVEYAACSVDAVLQLRATSIGFRRGMTNLFALMYREHPAEATLDMGLGIPIADYVGEAEATGQCIFLAASYVYRASPAGAALTAVAIPMCGGEINAFVGSLVRLFSATIRTVDVEEGLDDAGLRAVAEHCPGLRSLTVAECGDVTADAVAAVARGCPLLELLDLTGTSGAATLDAVAAVGARCPGLQTLILRGGALVEPLDRERWGACFERHLGALEDLCLGRNGANVTDEGVAAVARACPKLTSIDLAHNPRVTDAAVVALTEHCPGLRSLDLTGASISAAAVACIAERLGGLEHLDLHGTPAVATTARSLRALADGCPRLQYLRIGVPASSVPVSAVVAVLRRCPALRTFVAPNPGRAAPQALLRKLRRHAPAPECELLI